MREPLVLHALGRHRDAIASCDRAIELQPGRADSHVNRAELLAHLGRADEALLDYERAIALSPVSSLAQLGRADALYRLGRADEALAAYDRVVRAPRRPRRAQDPGQCARREQALRRSGRVLRARRATAC